MGKVPTTLSSPALTEVANDVDGTKPTSIVPLITKSMTDWEDKPLSGEPDAIILASLYKSSPTSSIAYFGRRVVSISARFEAQIVAPFRSRI